MLFKGRYFLAHTKFGGKKGANKYLHLPKSKIKKQHLYPYDFELFYRTIRLTVSLNEFELFYRTIQLAEIF